MTGFCSRNPFCFVQKLAFGISCFVFALAPTLLSANDSDIIRVEEDWQMVVGQPVPASHSPQVTFFLTPNAQFKDCYFQLQMNYAAEDAFSGGGFHVGAFKAEQMVDQARSPTNTALSQSGDQIKWTSVMAIIDNRLLFAIKDGSGAQWGTFGGPEYLVRIHASPVQDLSAYRPQDSVDAVDIGFGANRVSSITLAEARVYYADGREETVLVNHSL